MNAGHDGRAGGESPDRLPAFEGQSEGVAFVRERRRRVLTWAGLGATIAGLTVLPGMVGLAFYPLMGVAVVLLRSYFGPPRVPGGKGRKAARVAASLEGITITTSSGEERIARGKVVSGWVDSFAGEHQVVLQLAGDDALWIRMRHPDEARAFLHALGLAPEQHVFAARLVSPGEEEMTPGQRQGFLAGLLLFALWGLFPLFVLFSSLHGHGGLIFAATVVALLSVATGYVLPRTVLVGTDGVVVKRMGRKRFVPWSEVSNVRTDERGVWLDRVGGREPLLLATEPRSKVHVRLPNGPPLSASTVVLRDRIHEARAAGSGASGSGARFAVLDRRGRPLDEWQRDLRGLLTGGAAGYRQAPVEAEELARVVEDGGAPVERRIAAAVAIGGSAEPALRQRIRIAVDACADRDLRAAIERAAEGEIDEVEIERAARARA